VESRTGSWKLVATGAAGHPRHARAYSARSAEIVSGAPSSSSPQTMVKCRPSASWCRYSSRNPATAESSGEKSPAAALLSNVGISTAVFAEDCNVCSPRSLNGSLTLVRKCSASLPTLGNARRAAPIPQAVRNDRVEQSTATFSDAVDQPHRYRRRRNEHDSAHALRIPARVRVRGSRAVGKPEQNDPIVAEHLPRALQIFEEAVRPVVPQRRVLR
jgi:hypothetical protein